MGLASQSPDDLAALAALAVEFSAARDWTQFHSVKNLAMALSGEVGEVSALLQWVESVREESWLAEHRDDLAGELADVAIYLLLLSSRSGIDLADAIRAKVAVNEVRYPVHEAKGSAAKYNQKGETPDV